MSVEHSLVLTLYQAEWCPYSSAVRQRLTELGIDFVAKQVAPRQEDREGQHKIPLLTNRDGERFEGTEAIFEFLTALGPGAAEHQHRAQYRAHRPDRARETTASVLADQAPLDAPAAQPLPTRGGGGD